MRTRLLTMLVGGVLAGCMMSDADGMRDSVGDARRENQTYLVEARAASSLPMLVNEVDRHSAHMSVILDDMQTHMSGMQHCAGVGSMMNLRDGMQVEVNDHRTTMHAMTELPAARAAIETHVTMMDSMLDEMGELAGMHCGSM